MLVHLCTRLPRMAAVPQLPLEPRPPSAPYTRFIVESKKWPSVLPWKPVLSFCLGGAQSPEGPRSAKVCAQSKLVPTLSSIMLSPVPLAFLGGTCAPSSQGRACPCGKSHRCHSPFPIVGWHGVGFALPPCQRWRSSLWWSRSVVVMVVVIVVLS